MLMKVKGLVGSDFRLTPPQAFYILIQIQSRFASHILGNIFQWIIIYSGYAKTSGQALAALKITRFADSDNHTRTNRLISKAYSCKELGLCA